MRPAAAQKRRAATARFPLASTPPFTVRLGRGAALVLVILAGLLIVCALAGLAATERNEIRAEAERHAALQAALDELGGSGGVATTFAPDDLRRIARLAKLDDLRFDTALAPDDGREAQSLHDTHGRITGWLSWAVDRSQYRATIRLWRALIGLGAALAACGLVAAWVTRRLTRQLAELIDAGHRLLSEDVLTGLPNRAAMLERLEDVLARRQFVHPVFAVLDLDGFHEVNDTLGRAGGDALLIDIAERLEAALPPTAVLGRFDNDQFAVICPSENANAAAECGELLAASFREPFFLDQSWRISACIGVAQAPDDGIVADELSRHAVLALRAARHEGRGTVRRFAPQIRVEHAERRFFRRELELAIAQETLDVHYQPVVAAAGSAIVGVEALVRWTHPTRGAVAPSFFIPLAEQGGLMNRLGELVLRRALADAARWPSLFVSVNLSPVQMRDPGLVDLVGRLLAVSGTEPSRLVLEITEGILIDKPEEAKTLIIALRALGVKIALDDFGTGYSSLSYLQKFPFDRLKIDRAFVGSLGTSGNTAAIIQSIVTLGHVLGMKVLAEGVETDEQRVLLRLAGCDEMQGYLFAKAAPAGVVEKMLLAASPVGPSPARARLAAS